MTAYLWDDEAGGKVLAGMPVFGDEALLHKEVQLGSVGG
jgi:hypothetical protein